MELAYVFVCVSTYSWFMHKDQVKDFLILFYLGLIESS